MRARAASRVNNAAASPGKTGAHSALNQSDSAHALLPELAPCATYGEEYKRGYNVADERRA